MSNNYREALSAVRASEGLKDRAIAAVKAAKPQRKRANLFRAACACAMGCLAFFGIRAYVLETAYVSLDVNPSIALAINDYGLVIETAAYNEESEAILEDVLVKNKGYEEAVRDLLSADAMQEYLAANPDLWIAVQANNPATELRMEQQIQNVAADAVMESHPDTVITAHRVTENVRETSQSEGVSATKYEAICELQAVNPEAEIDAYRDCTITEIHEVTEACAGHAHAAGQTCFETAGDTASVEQVPASTAPEVAQTEVPVPTESVETPVATAEPVTSHGHHQERHRYGHHD